MLFCADVFYLEQINSCVPRKMFFFIFYDDAVRKSSALIKPEAFSNECKSSCFTLFVNEESFKNTASVHFCQAVQVTWPFSNALPKSHLTHV